MASVRRKPFSIGSRPQPTFVKLSAPLASRQQQPFILCGIVSPIDCTCLCQRQRAERNEAVTFVVVRNQSARRSIMVSSEHTALRHGDQLHRRYAIREWCCVDGELTCFRVYLPIEGRDGPEGFEQTDLLTADTELAERANKTAQGRPTFPRLNGDSTLVSAA